MARRSTVVHEGQVGHTVGHHHPAEFLANQLARQHAATGKVHGREEVAVGHLCQAFARAAHADEGFDFVVVRRDILVAERPIFPIAVAVGCFELIITISIALARPTKGFATHLAPANPHEGLFDGERVGILVIVNKKLMTELVARVAKPLDGLAVKQRLTVAKAAKLDLIRPDVFGEVTRGQPWWPGFQHEDEHALLGQLLGHPAATRTRADNQRVVDCLIAWHDRALKPVAHCVTGPKWSATRRLLWFGNPAVSRRHRRRLSFLFIGGYAQYTQRLK